MLANVWPGRQYQATPDTSTLTERDTSRVGLQTRTVVVPFLRAFDACSIESETGKN